MWTSAGAAVGVITKLVDVHTTLSRGVTALDIVGDGCRRCFGRLIEGDGALDGGVTAEYSDYMNISCQPFSKLEPALTVQCSSVKDERRNGPDAVFPDREGSEM